MIKTLSHSEASQVGLPAAQTQNVDPQNNPAHILAPPNKWLAALADGTYSWPFFRLRYKTLLRARFKDEPERFQHLLEASQGGNDLYLTCHCETHEHCHRELAQEFLENLRSTHPALTARPVSITGDSLREKYSGKRNAHSPAMILNALIEHPQAASR